MKNFRQIRNILLRTVTLIIFLTNTAFGQQANFEVKEYPSAQRVDVLVNGNLFTSLRYADSLKKHILYPLNAASGVNVTRGYPIQPQAGDQVDHPHQMGLWLNYGDVNGADYWNNSTKIDTNKKAYGTIVVKQVRDIRSGKGEGGFTVLATWYNPGGQAVLDEKSEFTFRAEGKLRSVTRKTTLTALTDVDFKDNKEGLFAIRVARQLEHPSEKPVKVITGQGTIDLSRDDRIGTGSYESSTEIKGEDVFGTRSKWLKLSGTIQGEPITVAILDHASNVNYPGYWMARGYGLFATNPLGAAAYTNGRTQLNFKLAKHASVIFRHQILISDSLSNKELEKRSDLFSSSR